MMHCKASTETPHSVKLMKTKQTFNELSFYHLFKLVTGLLHARASFKNFHLIKDVDSEFTFVL